MAKYITEAFYVNSFSLQNNSCVTISKGGSCILVLNFNLHEKIWYPCSKFRKVSENIHTPMGISRAEVSQ